MKQNRLAAIALALLLSGCALDAKIGAVATQTPGVLAELEQTKTAIATAPLAGCVSIIQQASTLLKAMATGTPAIPVSPGAPPILTVPPGSPTPTTLPPIPAPTPVPTS